MSSRLLQLMMNTMEPSIQSQGSKFGIKWWIQHKWWHLMSLFTTRSLTSINNQLINLHTSEFFLVTYFPLLLIQREIRRYYNVWGFCHLSLCWVSHHQTNIFYITISNLKDHWTLSLDSQMEESILTITSALLLLLLRWYKEKIKVLPFLVDFCKLILK